MAAYLFGPRFHRDPRVIAARKQYRLDLKAGVPEREAWARQKAVNDAVFAEIAKTSARKACANHQPQTQTPEARTMTTQQATRENERERKFHAAIEAEGASIDAILFSWGTAACTADVRAEEQYPDGLLKSCAWIVAGVRGAKTRAIGTWRACEVRRVVQQMRDALDELNAA